MNPSRFPSPVPRAPRIVMVGGGSYNWCPRLLCDVVQADELEGSEVVLWDLLPEAAEDIKGALERVCADNRRRFTFTVARTEEEAFRDADYVIITISTGGLEMMRHDLDIPDRYRIYQPVGDSVGPGGWARLLRNVPVFVNMAQTIERLAPDAVILNYTNPMAGLTGAITEACSLRTVGLCHGMFGTLAYLARILGVEKEDMAVRFGGVNHFFWILDFAVKGRNGYEMLREKLGGDTLLKYDKASQDPAGFSDNNHLLFSELFESYGYLTYSADRHTCEFFNRYLTDLATLERYKLTRTTIEDRRKGLARSKELTRKLTTGEQPMLERSMETAVDIMKSLATNTPFIDVVNLPNTGQIDNLPRGAVVETLGLVNSRGFSPIGIGNLPPALLQLSEVHCRIQLMTLQAALTGDKALAFEALAMDPLCAHLSPLEVRRMGGELLEATRDYLPQFRI